VEGTTFGWVIHGGDDHITDQSMFVREINDYKRLYTLDVFGIENRGENDQLNVLKEFKDDEMRQEDGRYEVRVPEVRVRVPGSTLASTNKQESRKRLQHVNKKLIPNQKQKQEYEKIVVDQLRDGIIARVPELPSGERIFFMPHKPVVRDNATTTKVTMVFDASCKPHQPEELGETVKVLEEYTYVDNLMKTGHDVESLQKFKEEATEILGDAKFPVHKWESNVIALGSENMPNPGKILGHSWDKREDTLVIQVQKSHQETPLTKRIMLSQLGKVYGATMAQAK